MNAAVESIPWSRSAAVRDHLRPWLEWLLHRHADQGGMTEIRIIAKGEQKGIWSCCIGPEDLDRIVEALGPRDGSTDDHPRVGEANIYFSVNPVDPSVGTSVGSQLRRARTAVKDRDIVAYDMFVVDVDPERIPRDRSATLQEKTAARDVAERVREWFVGHGIRPIVADSGNGWHLLIPLVPARGEDVRRTALEAHRLLKWLDKRFSTAAAKIDTSTYNPSRVLKLYGTKAVKGEDRPEHPHRFASVDLARIPEDVDLFGRLAELGVTDEPATAPHVPARQTTPNSPAWTQWRSEALRVLPLERVFGDWLTGDSAGNGWLQCRDPWSASGDRNPSAGVADGTGEAERATFHSFRSGQSHSVFDFLVQIGRAATFGAACRLIAELSGVALPESASRFDPTRLKDEWSRTQAATRNDVLREALGEITGFPALEQKQALDAIRETTGVPITVLRQTLAEVRKANRTEARPAPAAMKRAVVDFVQNRDTIESLFDALVKAVRPANRFFRTEREMVYVRRGLGPTPVTERNVAGLLSALVEIRFLVETDDDTEFLRYDVLPGHLARAFVTSPRVFHQLPMLEMYARAPLFDRHWNFVGRPGFHEPSGIFYDGPAVELRSGVETLCQALADFHWKAEADQVNFVGALLTSITMPHWGRGHPFLAINGNKPGVGKSTLARVLGVVVEGSEPNTVSYVPDDGEFEKQLATRVEAGDRVIVIDNAKTRKPIESGVLERCITDSRLNFRRLGSNSSISRPSNDILFCLTMNLTQMGQDLRRRALPLNLELSESARTTSYRTEDVVGFATEHRLAIVGELANMVKTWLDAGRPECEKPARHSTSQRWAATIDAILRLSGFDGFLTNFEDSEHAFDPRFQAMLDIAREHHARPAGTSAKWVGWLGANSPLEDRFRDRHGQARTDRAKATLVGALFTDYLDARFPIDGRTFELVREFPDGPTRSPTYRFRLVEGV